MKNDKMQIVKFDLNKMPQKKSIITRIFLFLYFLPQIKKRKLIKGQKIDKPSLIISNHLSKSDYLFLLNAIFPKTALFVVDLNEYITNEEIHYNLSSIAVRKLNSSEELIKKIYHVIHVLKENVVIYPENFYSLFGTTSYYSDKVVDIIKKINAPIYNFNINGSYLSKSVWSKKTKKVKISATLKEILSTSDVKRLNSNDIKRRVDEALYYDEFQYQKENDIVIKDNKRAEGIENILYKCPSCKNEDSIKTVDNEIVCTSCQKRYRLEENGEITATCLKTEYQKVPQWLDFEREAVRNELINGKFKINEDVLIKAIYNSSEFINLGNGKFLYDVTGLRIHYTFKGREKILSKDEKEEPLINIKFGDDSCLIIPFEKETLYISFVNKNINLVKIKLAFEELYKLSI